jgi:RNA recognition motif-containing protein
LIEFEKAADADYAWRKYDGLRLHGRDLKIEWATPSDFKFFGWKWTEAHSPSPKRRRSPRHVQHCFPLCHVAGYILICAVLPRCYCTSLHCMLCQCSGMCARSPSVSRSRSRSRTPPHTPAQAKDQANDEGSMSPPRDN